MLSPFKDYFIIFTPLNLIISALILLSQQFVIDKKFIIFCLFCFFCGFMVEFIGVHYGLIFGSYSYGPTLGYQINGVPLIIGLNWLMVIYSVGTMVHTLKVPVWLKVIIGAGLATLLDVVIEPVATEYNFWRWENGIIPLSNYIGWFTVSAIMLTSFYLLKINTSSRIPLYFYKIQLLFFLALYLL